MGTEVKRRVNKACDRCRRRKIKCNDIDEVEGKCSNCIKFKTACTFRHHEEMMRRSRMKAEKRIEKSRESEGNWARNEFSGMLNFMGVGTTDHKFTENMFGGGFVNGEGQALRRGNQEHLRKLGGGNNGMDEPNFNGQDIREVPYDFSTKAAGSAMGLGNVGKLAPIPTPLMSHSVKPLSSDTEEWQSSVGLGVSRLQQDFAANVRHEIAAQVTEHNNASTSPGYLQVNQNTPKPLPIQNPPPSDFVMEEISTIRNKLDAINRKVTLMIDWIAKLDYASNQCEKILESERQRSEKTASKCLQIKVLPNPNHYKENNFKANSLFMLKSYVAPVMSNTDSIDEHMKNVHELVSRWYFVNMKRLVYTITIDSDLHTLPSHDRCERIMEAFFYLLEVEDLNVVESETCKKLFCDYFSKNGCDFSYSEHLLINILLALGTLYCRHSRVEPSQFRKDKLDFTFEQLSEIEQNCYENAIYYFHKVSMVCEGLQTVQGLLLLFTYMKITINSEAASNIFSIAVKFAKDLLLNNLEAFHGKISQEEYLQIRSIWLFCYMNDSLLSMTLDRAPLINEIDMSVRFGSNYFLSIRCESEVSHLSDSEALKLLRKEEYIIQLGKENISHISVFMNYYKGLLCEISNKMVRYLFSLDAAIVTPFDDIISRILELKEDLKQFSDNLPEYLERENQRAFLARTYHELAEDQNILIFELINVLMTEIHVKRESLFIRLANYALGFLNDNRNLFKHSSHNCEDILDYFETNCTKAYKNALTTSKTVDFKDTMVILHRNNFFYEFFTIIMSSISHCIKHIRRASTFEILSLLRELNVQILGQNPEPIILRQVNWLVSVFFSALEMDLVTLLYTNKCQFSSMCALSDSRYKIIMEKSEKALQEEVDSLVASFFKKKWRFTDISHIISTNEVPRWLLIKGFDQVNPNWKQSLANWWHSEVHKMKVEAEFNILSAEKQLSLDPSSITEVSVTSNLKPRSPPSQSSNNWSQSALRLFRQDPFGVGVRKDSGTEFSNPQLYEENQ